MTVLLRYRIAFSTVFLGVLVGLAADLWHRQDGDFDPLQFVRRPGSVQTRDDAALLSGWLDRIDNSWEVGKNHQRVRSAFSDVVANARKSTVRIFRGEQQVAMGTVVDARGFVLTKASEVANQKDLVCQLPDRRKRKAEVVGILLQHDLAMLKIDANRLTPVQWYTQETPTVGSLLATPHHGQEPLAVGIVSLAPLEVSNDGVLGIRLRNGNEGPYVTDVIDASAADVAGILNGDIVLRVDTQAVATSDALVSAISRRLPGETLVLDILRGEDQLSVYATLGRRTDLDQENSNFQSFLGGALSERRTGFQTVLQHDTFLLPEHCGGPVVDLEGRVIGINIARAERIASYALPASAVVPWLDGLMAGEYTSLAVHQSQDAKTRQETK
jgi:serine protease Do